MDTGIESLDLEKISLAAGAFSADALGMIFGHQAG